MVARQDLRRAVFLDRDGVLNKAPVRGGKSFSPQSVAEVEIPAGVAEALVQLRAAGFLTVVVTNQPDVANGKQTRAGVEEINRHLQARLALDAVKVCYHADADGCDCRKPKPGMILDAARELSIDVKKSYLVGDRWRDVGAAQAAGCVALFIDYKYQEKQPDSPYITVKSLADAAQYILRSQ